MLARPVPPRRGQAAFTVAALSTVIVAVAGVASIAFPSYGELVRRSQRFECAATLEALAVTLEQWHAARATYRGAAEGGADAGPPAVHSSVCLADGDVPTYALSIVSATATAFALQAVPVGAQASDACGTLTLTSSGIRGVSGRAADTSPQACWG